MAGKPLEKRSRTLPAALVLCRRLATGIVLAYAATSVILGGSFAAKGVFCAATASWTSLVIGASVLPVHSVPQRKFAGRSVRLVELIAFNLALTLVLGEGALRVAAALSGHSLVLRDTLESYLLTPGRDYGQGLRGNRLGFPAADFVREKQPGVVRLAALGDSFAIGPAVPFDKNYLTRLEALRPGLEVYNFGVSGTGPREYHLILNQHVWDYQPDLVLVSIFVGNDITEWLATPREMDPRQSSLYLLCTRGGRLLRERSRQATMSRVPDSNRCAGSGLSREAFLDIEARRLAICRKDLNPGLEKKWQRTLGYLDRIIRDCHARGAPVAFVLIPDEFQVNPAVLADALGAAGISQADIDLDAPQRRLRAFFADRQARCLDLLPAFAGHVDTYAPRDTHWNERGNELAARRIADWLSSAWK